MQAARVWYICSIDHTLQDRYLRSYNLHNSCKLLFDEFLCLNYRLRIHILVCMVLRFNRMHYYVMLFEDTHDLWRFCRFDRYSVKYHRYFVFVHFFYRVRHNYINTHFMIVLDEKQSNLEIC